MPLLSELENQPVIALVRLWCNLSVNGALPIKQDINAIDVARTGTMPFIWLLERKDDDREIICRLAGDEIIHAVGKPLRGRKVSEVYDPLSYRVIAEEWNRVMDAGQTCHNKGIIAASQGRRYHGERVALPMADRYGRSQFVLGATLYTELHDLYAAEEAAEFFSKDPAVFTPWRAVVASFSESS
ncbi:MAG: PAS domain-containing protein [Alphaproteobacteria bacterium]